MKKRKRREKNMQGGREVVLRCEVREEGRARVVSSKTPAQLQAESTWLDCRGTRWGEELINKAISLFPEP